MKTQIGARFASGATATSGANGCYLFIFKQSHNDNQTEDAVEIIENHNDENECF